MLIVGHFNHFVDSPASRAKVGLYTFKPPIIDVLPRDYNWQLRICDINKDQFSLHSLSLYISPLFANFLQRDLMSSVKSPA